MDFHTMVSNFKRGVLKEEKDELEELTRASRKIVRRYIADGTPGRHTPKYSFNHLFGDEKTMRLVIPLQANVQIEGTRLFKRIVEQGWEPAFTSQVVKQKRQRLAAQGGGEYEEDITLPVLTMKKETERVIPKGPRAGEKVISTKKMSLAKLVQRIGSPEDKAWWAQNQGKVQNDKNALENVQNYFLKPWLNDFEGFAQERPIIVISRHPIDVARMSDFSLTNSCHSEGSGYFHCAVQESKGHGMIAFLVKGEEADDVKRRIEVNAEEIFRDVDVGMVNAPEPIARVRLRKLFNPSTGEEFATVEDRVYGINVPDFLPTVQAWARDNQKDMWLGEDGEMVEDFVNDSDWILVGGEYLDTDIGDQLTSMFADTEYDEDAENNFSGMSFQYEDYYDEEDQTSDLPQAEERLDDIIRDANDTAEHVSFGGQIEEGWDDMPWYVSVHCAYSFELQIDPNKVDEIPDTNNWSESRGFRNDFVNIFENFGPYSEYDGWEFDYYVSGDTIEFNITGQPRLEQSGLESVDEVSYWVREVIEDIDDKFKSIRSACRAELLKIGLVSPGVYEKAVDELVLNKQYENFQILFDEDDPGDGIDIVAKPSEDGSDRMGRDRKFYKIVDNFPSVTPDGLNVSERFKYLLDRSPLVIGGKVRAAFKRAVRKSEREAQKQIQLPLGSKYDAPKKSIGTSDIKMDVKVAAIRVPFRPPGRSQPIPVSQLSDEQAEKYSKLNMDIAYRFLIKIEEDVTELDYEEIKSFLEFLDKNLETFEDSVRAIAAEIYKNAESQVRYAQKMDQQDADNISEDIENIARKYLLKEQDQFETRLFQVNLRIQIAKGVGGGIEQKLNRIRAIDGVTVVSHEEGQKVGDLRVIEAKVKFHPSSDSLRPASYVQRVLVPEINSSNVVPGVKVIEIVSGTLKRLDK